MFSDRGLISFFLAVIPKEHTVVSFPFRHHVIQLFGDQLIMRSAERCVKKFKQRHTIEL
jgi:RNase P/RNase MRP subunit p29